MTKYETGRPADVDVDDVRTHADLAVLLGRLHADYEHDGRAEWTNATLADYLEALAALTEALPHRYANRGQVMPEHPTWQMIATLLVGATGYE